MKQTTGFYPRLNVDTTTSGAVAQAGGVLLTETVAATGIGRELSTELARWFKPLAIHDPAKVLTDLAVTLALGGDCLADIALLRGEPGVYGLVASDATVSRTIDALAADAPAALKAINTARAGARTRAWALAGTGAPDHGTHAKNPLIVDLDATLVASHSEKENAKSTFKRGFGFHPLCAFVDHGPDGTGEPLAMLLRPGNAGSNTAVDHLVVIKAALAQLPGHTPGTRPGRKVLIRIDGAGSTHAVLDWLTTQRLSYSVGYSLPAHTPDLLELIPEHVWAPAYDAHDAIRDGAWVAELTDLLHLDGWPKGMRVIVRKERPHPGAQLTITDIDGHRITAFATNTRTGGPGTQLADLELRHRRRARCEDRIRIAKAPPAPGRREVPPPGCARSRCSTSRRTRSGARSSPSRSRSPRGWEMLALHGHPARRWEPKRLRLRLFTVPATLARTGRRILLHLASKAPWAQLAGQGITRLRALAAAPG